MRANDCSRPNGLFVEKWTKKMSEADRLLRFNPQSNSQFQLGKICT
jgi:hypothetical protein